MTRLRLPAAQLRVGDRIVEGDWKGWTIAEEPDDAYRDYIGAACKARDDLIVLTLCRDVLATVAETGPDSGLTDLLMSGVDVETRRTWFPASEQVHVERDSEGGEG